MNRKVLIKLSLLFIPLLLLVSLEFWAHRTPEKTSSEGVQVTLSDGQSLSSFSRELKEAGVIGSSKLFQIYVRLRSNYRKFQAGNYLFQGSLSPSDIIKQVYSGDIYTPVLFKITVTEGARMDEIFSFLMAEGYSKEELESLAYDKSFLGELGIKADSLEGYLYPSTYRFYHQVPSVKDILKKMVDQFFAVLGKDYQSRFEENGLSLHKAVIIASLIEKETSILNEKPMVAEVILNRLRDRIKLGVDASTIYGIKDFDGNLTKDDLKDKKNLYNTRAHYGLPPGPIASPSFSSFRALLNPTNKGYYYYVLKPGAGQKEHEFSRTFSEHKFFVKKLKESQEAQRKDKLEEKKF